MKPASRIFFVFSFLLLFSFSINAYTLILKGGGRVEVPDNFIVTTAGVSYTVGSGIGVTVQMTNIDVAATERANGEAAGSFLSRIGQVKKQETSIQIQQPSSAQKPANTITNLDLNSYRVARERDEAIYEQNRAMTGFPSREELQKRNEEETQKLKSISEQQAQQDAEAEAYWRNRANALRTEIYALNAEIAYVQARINEEPTYTIFYSYAPPRPNINTPPPANVYQPVGRVGQRNYGVSGSVNLGGGSTQGNVGFYYQGSSVSYYPNNGIDAFGYYPYYGYAPPFPVRYQSYNRMQLVSRLQSLEQSRVGLLARWELLEEEARRAGALPGWLR